MIEERVEFTVVLNAVGGPLLTLKDGERNVSDILPRCDMATCHHVLKGPCVKVTLDGHISFYHAHCAPKPLPKPENL